VEVEALDPPTEELRKTMDSMTSRGIKLLYGRWLIDGAPRVLLFDTGSAWSRLDEWKADLWSVAGIPAPPGDQETNETIVFGYLVAWFLGEALTLAVETNLVRLAGDVPCCGGPFP
jgi:glycogen synthase